MFETDVSRSAGSNAVTRRIFAGGLAAIVASVVALRLTRFRGVEASVDVHGTPGEVTIVSFSDDERNLGRQTLSKIVKTDGEWYRQLGRNSFGIARRADTELPYTGVSWNEHSVGLYRCICCDTALFSSQTKFDSGTGWPSFWAPLAKENVIEKSDLSMGVERTEVECARCEGHLGHVFTDGPQPTGLRYCMNSASLRFVNSHKDTA